MDDDDLETNRNTELNTAPETSFITSESASTAFGTHNRVETVSFPPLLVSAAGYSWRILTVALAITLLGLLAYELRVIVVPTFVALLLSSLLLPIVKRLEKSGLKSGPATAITFVFAIGLLVGLVYSLASPVSREFRNLGPELSKGVGDVEDWIRNGPLHLSQTQIDTYIDQGIAQAKSHSRSIQTGVVSGATLVGEVIIGIFVSIIMTFFFLKDRHALETAIVSRFPAERREDISSAIRRAYLALSGYLRGVAMTGIVDALFIGIALVALRVPLLLPLVILTFFGAFFPIVGATSAGGVAALVALVSGGFTKALFVVLAVLLVQQLEGHLLQPLLVGRAVRLHPIVMIFALAAGGIAAGVLGAFLAVPILAMVIAALRELETRRDARYALSAKQVTPQG